ncbi:MAG: ABC transporter substrate-binding protein [Patescibacteria group bacterium]
MTEAHPPVTTEDRREQNQRAERWAVSLKKNSTFPSWKQWKVLRHYLDPKESRRLLAFIFTIAICAGILLGRGYHANTIAIPASGGEYTEALVGAPQFINPLYASTSDTDLDLTQLVYTGLLRVNKEQKLIPDLATGYEISEDQLTYTFHLRDDVRFHDGQSFTAEDVAFTILAIQNPAYASPLRGSFAGAQINVTDPATIQFILPEAFTPFLSSLTVGILPKHLWQDIPPDAAKLNERNIRPIGTGSYQFDQLIKEDNGFIRSYRLIRNARFYRDVPHIEKLTFQLYSDLYGAINATEQKIVDGISFIPKQTRVELEKNNQTLRFYNLSLPQYSAVFFNQNQSKILASAKIREALTQATDKERIIREALNGEGQVIHGPILPGYSGYHSDVKKYLLNIEEAKTILDAAGWKPEKNGVRWKDSVELNFSLTTSTQPELQKTVTILKEDWEKIGARVDLKTVDQANVFRDVIKPRNYDALVFGQIVGSDPDPYPFWHSSQAVDPGLNLAIFFNKTVNRLLEDARKEKDDNERGKKYIAFQNILAEEEFPAIFLYSPTYVYAVDRRVKGVRSSYITSPADRFASISEWYIKTDRRWKINQ